MEKRSGLLGGAKFRHVYPFENISMESMLKWLLKDDWELFDDVHNNGTNISGLRY